MARIGFDVNDPTFGIPGVVRVGDREVSFESEEAARKWFSLRRVFKKKNDIEHELEQDTRRLTEAREQLAQATPGSDAQTMASISINRLEKKIRDLEGRLNQGTTWLEQALEQALVCNVEETVRLAQLGHEGYATGVDTSGPGLGLPVPDDDESAIGIRGRRGRGWIRPNDHEKHLALDRALSHIAELERALLELELELARPRVEQAREQLQELEERLRQARTRLEQLQSLDPYSLGGARAVERAEQAVEELERAIEEAQDRLDAVEDGLEERLREIEALIRQIAAADWRQLLFFPATPLHLV